MTVLDIRDLSLSIGSTPILKNVSLSVAPGEILGLVGESGSGKSMTSLAVLGLTPPRATLTGDIRLNGQLVSGAPDAALQKVRGRDVGIIFQEPMTALNPVMTIGDQVAETVRLHKKVSRKEALAVARSVLDRVGLPAERFPLTRYPHELSGGQRQRVAIAIAIALTPKLLIADEATTALDVTTQAQVLDLLKRLVREDGMGLILITHDLAVVAETADRLAVMKDGELVEDAPVARIRTGMAHPYSRRLLANATHAPTRRSRPRFACSTRRRMKCLSDRSSDTTASCGNRGWLCLRRKRTGRSHRTRSEPWSCTNCRGSRRRNRICPRGTNRRS